MGRPMAPRPMKPTRTTVDATSAAPYGGRSVERWRVDELVFVSQVAPYADGPAGVHGVLDQAGTAAVQLGGMHDLDTVVVDDVTGLDADRLARARALGLFTIGETPWRPDQRRVILDRLRSGALAVL